MGMVAAALGYRRPRRDMKEHERAEREAKHRDLVERLGFAVRLDMGGVYMKDYHTIQTPQKVKNLPTRTLELRQAKIGGKGSHREYYTDQFATICLWKWPGERGPTLNAICACLNKPVFALYLGRKACPQALPLQPCIEHAARNWRDALDCANKTYRECIDDLLGYTLREDPPSRYFWEGNDHAGLEHHYVEDERWDQPASRLRWQFQPRREFMWSPTRE